MIALNDEYKGRWRSLLSQTYNGFGKITTKTDRLGLTTTTEYDAHERPVKTTDPFDNVHTFQYKDVDLKTTTFINDRKRTVVTKVPWQRKTVTASFPVTNNCHDKPTDVIEKTEIHDGFKKLIHQSTSLVDLSSLKKHSTVEVEHEYDANQDAVLSTVSTFDQRSIQKSRAFNLGGKLFTWYRTYTSPDMSSSHEGYRYHYDGDGLLRQVESPAFNGNHRLSTKHTYDSNGREIERVLQDGHVIDYQYNPRGLLAARSWYRNQKPYRVDHHYDADGKLTALSDSESQWMHYHYAQNGTLKALYYPDDRSLTLERDAYDRVYQQTDANGTVQEWVYKNGDKGRLSQIMAGDSRINFHYGEDDNGKKGQLVKRDFDAIGTGLTQTHYTYGALGRLIHSSSTNQLAHSTFKVDYAYDALGELTQLKQALGHANQSHTKTIDYRYDGLRRLLNEKHSTESGDENDNWKGQYQYDGNDNLISEHVNSSIDAAEHTEYFYNAMDQMVNVKMNGRQSPIPIIHDTNGRLMQDHKGRHYAYDDVGYLLKVSMHGLTDTAFHYWPNGLLGHTFKGQSHIDYYSDQQNNIQTVYKDNLWHSFIRQDKSIIGVKTDQGMGQAFTANQSMGAYLHLLGIGDISFEAQQYDAYGKVLNKKKNQDTVLNEFGWNQELNNPDLGLTYLKHRFYSPELRRFISRDSLNVDNRYAYVFANPVNYIDPTGHSPALNYALGSGFTALGILGAVLAVPTGGASLSLSAAAGIGAGVTSALSGMSLLGSQVALDAGNKTAAKALAVSSIALSVLAIGEVVVSLAPTISNAFAQASRFFGSSSAGITSSTGTSSSAVVDSQTATLSASGEVNSGVNSATAAANTEAVVSGWSVAATATENAADLTTDIFADHAVGTLIEGLSDGQVTNLVPMESNFPENVTLRQHAWLTRMRGWLFQRMPAEDVAHYIGRFNAEAVFSEEDLRILSEPSGLDLFKRFGIPGKEAKAGFSYYKAPLVN